MDEKKKSEVSILLEYVKVIVLTMIATFILLQFIQVSRVNGSSMENTYFQNNIVLIDKVFYKRPVSYTHLASCRIAIACSATAYGE